MCRVPTNATLRLLLTLALTACGSSTAETATTTTPYQSAPSPDSRNQPSRAGPIASPEDADTDGIVSSADLCPNDPEDRDGFEDADGCPDPDNDRDRIADMDDRCPNEPEVYDGVLDTDGCPDGTSVPMPTS